MKYYLSLLSAVLLNCNLVFPQPGKSIRVKAGEDIAQAYSPQGFYRFPQFSNATLYFKGSGRNTGILFNYNIFSGYMQFINPKGDTLDMANTTALDSMAFEKNIFLFNEGFIEIIARTDSLRLLKKLVLKTQVENIGAYGLPSATAAVTNMKSYSAGSGVYNLVINQDVVLIENVYWFFMNGSNIMKANKSNFLKFLPAEKQGKAETYLGQNKINFEKENDLKKLMAAIAN